MSVPRYSSRSRGHITRLAEAKDDDPSACTYNLKVDSLIMPDAPARCSYDV